MLKMSFYCTARSLSPVGLTGMRQNGWFGSLSGSDERQSVGWPLLRTGLHPYKCGQT
jgi:hypothetical protein